ncbi:MAG TPA: hypothetical protein VGP76_14285 [Planctomycetaceae bacterium]|jgi:hypothetical protein|nr:hypothetical protein [Planctomycetaceae bacterium]
MRLTLRTLLAYLDDILEPSQTKEIGLKLTESKFASDLVERIRDVMRRRRLSAPEVEVADGSLDANVMAAYLDNTLAPEKVTDVEKMCLESDMHLAEAAACHQILTMVLGEPVEIAPDSRRRMYGLVSQGSGDNHAAIAAGKPAAASPDRDELDDMPTPFQAQERTEKIDSLVPDYLRNRPFWKRALVVAAPVVLIGLWVGLYITDPASNIRDRWFGGSDNSAVKTASVDQNRPSQEKAAKVAKEGAAHATREPLANVADAAAAGGVAKLPAASTTGSTSPTPGPDTKQAAAEPPSPTSTAPSLPDVVPSTASTAPATASPGPPSSSLPVAPPGSTLPEITPKASPSAGTTPQVASTSSAKTGGAVPAPPAPGIPGTESKPATTSNSMPAKPDKVMPEAPLDVKLVSKSGVLLGYDPNRDDWFVLERPSLKLPVPTEEAPKAQKEDPANQLIAPTPPVPLAGERRADLLAAPEPFDSQLDLGDGLCRLWLIGGSSARLLAPAGASRFGIELREGRIVLRSGVPQSPGAAYTPLVVTLVVRGEQWQLEFLRPETQCGIEITPMFPNKPGQDAKEVGYRGGLYVVEGDVRFTEAIGRQRTLVAGRWISLAPGDLAVATDLSGSAFRGKGAVPAWLTPENHRLPPSLVKTARDFGEGFLPDQPVSLSIGTVAKNDRNPKIAELAAKTLALTRQYPTLVEVLAQVPHDEAVEAAARGLKAWLPLAVNNVTLLQKELSMVFVPAVEDIVLRLLWGYNDDDGRNLDTSKQLVEWLDNDKLAVRVLAIDQISRLTGGQTLRYRAGMRSAERKAIKRQWERTVEQNKGLIHK